MNRKIFKIAAVFCTFLVLGGCHFAEFGADRNKENVYEADFSGNEESSGDSSFSEEKSTEQHYIYVQVCGHVVNPGVYEVLEGSRMYEVIECAGGILADAGTDSLWLAKAVSDGDRIYVPGVDEDVCEQESIADGIVNINTADAAQLMTLPGIGESRAADILQFREENGAFESIEDIMKVPGIKTAAFNKIKDKIKT
jgi:competence protein ComEA